MASETLPGPGRREAGSQLNRYALGRAVGRSGRSAAGLAGRDGLEVYSDMSRLVRIFASSSSSSSPVIAEKAGVSKCVCPIASRDKPNDPTAISLPLRSSSLLAAVKL